MPRNFRSSVVMQRRQQGVVLLIALIVLVAMTLAGIGLVRSVDTANLVAGNMAFKQGVTLAADAGVEAAINWLGIDNRHASDYVNSEHRDDGYYANSHNTLDLTNTQNDSSLAAVDWDQNNCKDLSFSVCIKPSAPIPVGDNSVSYIIHRLCQKDGSYNDPSNSCVTYQSRDSRSPNRDALDPTTTRFEPLPIPYYRITARVLGPRNTVSFVQTVIHY